MLSELIIISYGIIKIRTIIAEYKKLSLGFHDFIYNIRGAFDKVFGKFALTPIIAGEIAIVRYGLLFWLGGKEVVQRQNYYSTYKKSGYIAIWCIILLMMIVETTGIHFLLWNWNKELAVIVTLLSVYGVIFFISDLAAVMKRPVVFHNNQLFLRIGIRWNAVIHISSVNSVEVIRNFDKKTEKIR